MRRILLPLDGSSVSRQIMARLGSLLEQPGIQVHLLGVVPDLAEFGNAWEAYAQRRLDLYAELEKARDRLEGDGRRVYIHLESGGPAERILAIESEVRPSLTAMTTLSTLEPVPAGPGRVAEKVRSCSRGPLLLLWPDPSWRTAEPIPRGFERILLPVRIDQDSPRRPAVLDALATFCDATFIFLFIRHGASDDGSKSESELARRLVEPLRMSGRAVSQLHREGHPARLIREAIGEFRIDLLVLPVDAGCDAARTHDEKLLRGAEVDLLLARPLPADAPAMPPEDPQGPPRP